MPDAAQPTVGADASVLRDPAPLNGTLAVVESAEALAVFASRFIRKDFRVRFLHEAVKKPGALHRRICHEIESVIDSSYKGRAAPFQANDQCLFLGWFSNISVRAWSEAKAVIDHGGGGYLVIKSDGSAFYAEAEGYPAQTYAGS